MSPRTAPIRPTSLSILLSAGLALVSLASAPTLHACSKAHPKPASSFQQSADAAAELVSLNDATAAEAWLTRQIAPGTALSELPDFFAAANEAFYDAQDALLIFVYRSAQPGRWVAWVGFDPERGGVVSTTATDL